GGLDALHVLAARGLELLLEVVAERLAPERALGPALVLVDDVVEERVDEAARALVVVGRHGLGGTAVLTAAGGRGGRGGLRRLHLALERGDPLLEPVDPLGRFIGAAPLGDELLLERLELLTLRGRRRGQRGRRRGLRPLAL